MAKKTKATSAEEKLRALYDLQLIDSRIDREARTAKVRAELPNAGDRLRPGMSFTLELNLPGEAALAAPEIALQWERKGAYLWRVEQNRALRAAVRLLARQDGMALVRNEDDAKNALKPGDKVVIEGVQRLKHGRKVEVVGQDDPAPADGAGGGQADEQSGAKLGGSRLAADQ